MNQLFISEFSDMKIFVIVKFCLAFFFSDITSTFFPFSDLFILHFSLESFFSFKLYLGLYRV